MRYYRCYVSTCGSNQRDPGIRFYRFPFKDNKLFREWAVKLGIKLQEEDDEEIIKQFQAYYVCHLHFTSDDFERDLKSELMGTKRKYKLKPDAVPSLLLPGNAKTRKQVDEIRLLTEKERLHHREIALGQIEKCITPQLVSTPRPDHFAELFHDEADSKPIALCLLCNNYFHCFTSTNTNTEAVTTRRLLKQFLTKNINNRGYVAVNKNVLNILNLCNENEEVQSCQDCSCKIKQLQELYDKLDLLENEIRQFEAEVFKGFSQVDIVDNQGSEDSNNESGSNELLDLGINEQTMNPMLKIGNKVVQSEESSKPFNFSNTGQTNVIEDPKIIHHEEIRIDTNSYEEHSDRLQKPSETSNVNRQKFQIIIIQQPPPTTGVILEKSDVPVLKGKSKQPKSPKKKQERKEVKKAPAPKPKQTTHKKLREKLIGPFKCDICSKEFKQPYHLKLHQHTHTGAKPYNCQLCDKKFHLKESLKSHSLVHSKEKNYFCEVCGNGYKTKRSLTCHLATTHQQIENPFVCTICSKEFLRLKELEQHTEMGHENGNPVPVYFQCEVCGKKVSSKAALGGHMRYVHCKTKRFECKECPAKFASSSCLKRHTLRHAGVKRDYVKCDYCEEKMKRFNKRKHMFQAHPEVYCTFKKIPCTACWKLFVTEAEMMAHQDASHYKCQGPNCNKVFLTSQKLKNHQTLHSEERPYECNICHACYSRADTLRLHVTRHKTEERPQFKCKECNQEFLKLNELQKHIQTKHAAPLVLPQHNSGRRSVLQNGFKCKECSRRFRSAVSLKQHSFRHIGINQCDYCEARFNLSVSKRKHMVDLHHDLYVASTTKKIVCPTCWKVFDSETEMRNHQDTSHYKCQSCGKVFFTGQKLKRHELVHTGEKPFKCDLCPKSFTQSANLKDHMFRHTGERPHKCQECNEGFFRRKELQNHMQKNHAVLPVSDA